jgi:hypothetical protein
MPDRHSLIHLIRPGKPAQLAGLLEFAGLFIPAITLSYE